MKQLSVLFVSLLIFTFCYTSTIKKRCRSNNDQLNNPVTAPSKSASQTQIPPTIPAEPPKSASQTQIPPTIPAEPPKPTGPVRPTDKGIVIPNHVADCIWGWRLMNRENNYYLTSGTINYPDRIYLNYGVENALRHCSKHGTGLSPLCNQQISTLTSMGGYNSLGVPYRCFTFGYKKEDFQNPIGMILHNPVCPNEELNKENPNEFLQPIFHYVPGSQRWGYLEHKHTGLYWTRHEYYNIVVLKKFTGAKNQMWRYFCYQFSTEKKVDEYMEKEKKIEYP
jgi:hypothetical protein